MNDCFYLTQSQRARIRPYFPKAPRISQRHKVCPALMIAAIVIFWIW